MSPKPTAILIILCIVLGSCSGVRMRKSELIPVDESLDLLILNNGTDKKGNSTTKTFLSIFDLYDEGVDTVHLKYDSLNLCVRFKNKYAKDTTEFKYPCTIDIKGYIEVYLVNKDIKIPPIIPIYVDVDINRKRMIMTRSGKLLVDNKVKSGGGWVLYSVNGIRKQLLFDILSHGS